LPPCVQSSSARRSSPTTAPSTCAEKASHAASLQRKHWKLPLTFGIDQDFYFKPQAGRLWLSPHDETPDIARDVAPEELAVALAIDRLARVTDWTVAAVERRWAGLRSFAPDRLPVYGFDAEQPGLFWFAGQGGFGIQTAPAAARLGAQLLLGLPADAMTESLDPGHYAPSRFS
jgi:D-arginine dehydrogenase